MTILTQKSTDSTKVFEGVLTAKAVYPDGSEKIIFEDNNLIMLASKQKMLRSIYLPGTYVSDPIKTLHIGIGGTLDPKGLYPKAPSQIMETLYSDVLSVDVTYSEDIAVPSVTFIADLGQGLGNNRLITEAGLFTSSGLLFNIKTFIGIPKTSEFSLHFEWVVRLS